MAKLDRLTLMPMCGYLILATDSDVGGLSCWPNTPAGLALVGAGWLARVEPPGWPAAFAYRCTACG